MSLEKAMGTKSKTAHKTRKSIAELGSLVTYF